MDNYLYGAGFIEFFHGSGDPGAGARIKSNNAIHVGIVIENTLGCFDGVCGCGFVIGFNDDFPFGVLGKKILDTAELGVGVCSPQLPIRATFPVVPARLISSAAVSRPH